MVGNIEGNRFGSYRCTYTNVVMEQRKIQGRDLETQQLVEFIYETLVCGYCLETIR